MIDCPVDTRPGAAGLKVLIADDDDEFRQALAEIVGMDGWQVMQARDGKEAIEATRTRRPDVLLLDHRMPLFTGVEVVLRLRADGNRVPVVFITAAYEIEELAASAGVVCHLRKPFGLDELSAMLTRAAQGLC